MQGNLEEGDSTILLPNQLDDISYLALDIGGSLIKLVYFSRRADHSNNDQGKRSIKEGLGISSGNRRSYPILGGGLHLVMFKTQNLNECLDFISSKQLHCRGVGLHKWHSPDGNAIIKATGGGAYKYVDLFKERLGLSLDKEDEMDCLVAGANFFLKAIHDEAFTHMEGQKEFVQINHNDLFPYLLVNIGSGVSMIKVDGDGSFQRVGGTSVGGGTYWGLGRLLTKCKSFDELLELSQGGDSRAIDILVGDIYGGQDYSKIGLSESTIASSFGKAVYEDKVLSDYRREDISLALLLMISYNIGQISYLNARSCGIKRIFFGGFFIRDHAQIMDAISVAIRYWSKDQVQAMFLRHEGFLGALGAFMSYEEHVLDDLMARHLVERFPMGAPYMGGAIHGPPLGDLNVKISWMEKFVLKGKVITASVPMRSPGTACVGGFERPSSKGDTLHYVSGTALNVVALHLEPTLEVFPLLADPKTFIYHSKKGEEEDMMSLSNTNNGEWAPKCRCGNGDMIFFTSCMQTNPKNFFWRCPNWNNENGCASFLCKDSASREQFSEPISAPLARDDGKGNLQDLAVSMEDLKKVIEMQNRFLRASIEEKREMKNSCDLQNLYLHKIYRIIMFMACITCVALAFLFHRA